MTVLEKSKRLFQELNAEAVLLKTSDRMPDSNVRYFTGLQKHFLSSNVLILKPGQRPLLLKSVLEPKISVKGLHVKRIDKGKQFKTVAKKELSGVKRLGINRLLYTSLGLRELRKITGKKKLVDVSKQIASLRAIKSEGELNCLAKSCKIAEKVASAIPGLFRKGMSEKRLGLEIEIMLREKGDNALPFPVIVASGKNSAFPHNVLTGKKITKGLLLFDFGAYFKGYSSDVTRVFSVGKPTKRQQHLYAKVFAAKQFGQALIKPGSVSGKVFDKVNHFLKKETGIKLIHGLGHGLGIDAHDFPSGFLHGNREKLQKNMVLTVEPGVYGRFGGIRIEDDVVVTAKGCRLLTKAPAELTQIR